MTPDFPEERDSTPLEPAIEIPPVLATVYQLEECNRVTTANFMALLHIVKCIVFGKCDISTDDEFMQFFHHKKMEALSHLDNLFARELEKRCGPDKDKQREYLMQHPESILFSGVRINQVGQQET